MLFNCFNCSSGSYVNVTLALSEVCPAANGVTTASVTFEFLIAPHFLNLSVKKSGSNAFKFFGKLAPLVNGRIIGETPEI